MPVVFSYPHTTNSSLTRSTSSGVRSSIVPTSSYMGSFQTKPSHVFFASQEPQEIVILLLRKHPITQVGWLILAVLIALLPVFFGPYLLNFLTDIGIPFGYYVVSISFWYLATFAFIYSNFILWYYDINIVTNQRVLDIDFASLLIQEVNATRIEQIEQVTFRSIGVLASLFDYGDVFVETAGAEVNIEFLSVPKPRQVVKLLVDLMAEKDEGNNE